MTRTFALFEYAELMSKAAHRECLYYSGEWKSKPCHNVFSLIKGKGLWWMLFIRHTWLSSLHIKAGGERKEDKEGRLEEKNNAVEKDKYYSGTEWKHFSLDECIVVINFPFSFKKWPQGGDSHLMSNTLIHSQSSHDSDL